MKKIEEGFQYSVKEGRFYRQGVQKHGRDICFTVAVPEGKRCSLLLYKKGETEVAASVPMGSSTRYGDLRSVTIEKLPDAQYEYNYLIGGEVVTDPYATRIVGREIWGRPVKGPEEVRGAVAEESYDWEGDAPLQLPFTEVVSYAAHVRGFTMHPSSRVRKKGTFRGIIEKIPYLKELGINQLELMPVYEFSETGTPETKKKASPYEPDTKEDGKLNYWGYAPGFYFAPKAAYSATGNPVREFKDLVKALHKNGIELILEFYFPRGTRQGLILDCVRHWVLEYHIDGVHVNGNFAPLTALAQEPLLSHTKLLTEGFPLEEIYEEKHTPKFRNLAEYNDGFMLDARRFLKGDDGQLQSFAGRAVRNPGTHAVFNYMANHNGFTLLDLVSYDSKHNEANGEDNRDGTDYNFSWNCGEEGPSRKKKIQQLRYRQLRNAFALLFLSQGTPLIYAGDEMGNSQNGNNNAYCQDNEISWVNWRSGKGEKLLTEYVKALIAFRKAHPVFGGRGELRMSDYLSCGYPDASYHGKRAWYGDFDPSSRSLGIFYAGDYIEADSDGEKKDAYFYVAYNMYWIPFAFALPSLPGKMEWRVALDTSKEELEGVYAEGQEPEIEEQKTVTVPERAVMVLIGR